jgi:hypothetical protein
VSALDPGYFRVTGAAYRQAVARLEAQMRMRPHRLDVVNLQPPPGAALLASPAVALQNGMANRLPFPPARYSL